MAGIYIHIPFCRQACHYCNFHFSTSLKLKDQVVHAISKEIEIKQDFFQDSFEIDTIYFGGGTPSLLTQREIELLLNKLMNHFTGSNSMEVTLEANPDDLTMPYLKQLKDSGITRLSIGIQSFNDSLLSYMNRAHNRDQAIRSLENSAALGFNDMNIDLIYGIPGLTEQAWMDDIEFALNFPIDHISAYALTVEPKTALEHFISKKKWPGPDDDATAKQFLMASEYLEAHGFSHYEISNFSKGTNYSKHNTAYWQGEPYLGIGPSAHSFKEGQRSWNLANNALYVKALHEGTDFTETELLLPKDRFNEYIMTGLRTKWGIDLEKIRTDFGVVEEEHVQKIIASMRSEHYSMDGTSIKLTKEGWLWSDGIAADLFL